MSRLDRNHPGTSRRPAPTRNSLRRLGRDLDLVASGDTERLRRLFALQLGSLP